MNIFGNILDWMVKPLSELTISDLIILIILLVYLVKNIFKFSITLYNLNGGIKNGKNWFLFFNNSIGGIICH